MRVLGATYLDFPNEIVRNRWKLLIAWGVGGGRRRLPRRLVPRSCRWESLEPPANKTMYFEIEIRRCARSRFLQSDRRHAQREKLVLSMSNDKITCRPYLQSALCGLGRQTSRGKRRRSSFCLPRPQSGTLQVGTTNYYFQLEMVHVYNELQLQ